ncbi:unnamed protein product [Protopolystoma xenopodis]|uniref:Uncharacterized protein n=1 Tax=Protopolystoma xenopodis TaxID=117903 RepID=A0A448X5P9_9PLAT|nr:unnamed protein product [Protopolystoma xenopodis]
MVPLPRLLNHFDGWVFGFPKESGHTPHRGWAYRRVELRARAKPHPQQHWRRPRWPILKLPLFWFVGSVLLETRSILSVGSFPSRFWVWSLLVVSEQIGLDTRSA